MRGLLLVAVVVGSVGVASAERIAPASRPTCQRASGQLAASLTLDAKIQLMVARRCEKDRWSREAQQCFADATTSSAASLCLDRLSKDQRRGLEGDADRANDAKLSRLLFRRSLIAQAGTGSAPASGAGMPPLARPVAMSAAMPLVTLASLDTTPTGDLRVARALHSQGLAAYQAGRYDLAVRKFEAALAAGESPELLFHAAQAYRMKGERAKAIAHYERYLELAPEGPAANACRNQLERLRDSLP